MNNNMALRAYCILLTLSVAVLPVIANAQASANYKLRDFTFGGGGTVDASSANYKALGVLGETDVSRPTSANYGAGAGLAFTLLANVPPAPALTNPSNFYNRLKLVLDAGGNAADAKFAVAISSDNFASDTRYVQSDSTIGSTLGLEDWQTYAQWGGAGGSTITGLVPSTTYTVKAAAKRGNFTESGFGPTAQAATVTPSLTFDIDVAPTDTETAPPFTVSLGDLTAGSVITSSDRIWVDVDTNGTAGALVYVFGANVGLRSPAANYTIATVSGNLGTASEGYGARGISTAQTSGGPIRILAPYDGTGDTVGILDTAKRIIFDSTDAPVTAGRASFVLKAKATAVTRAASDYTDTLTVLVSAAY